MQIPTLDELKERLAKIAVITCTAEKEDVNPEWQERHLGYMEGFAGTVRAMMKKYPVWGWCQVEVRATYGSHSGSAYLGGCSYTGKRDFMQPGGYYAQMVDEAITELARQIHHDLELLSPVLA